MPVAARLRPEIGIASHEFLDHRVNGSSDRRTGPRVMRTLGRVAWTIGLGSPKAMAYRDTGGPGPEGWRGMLGRAKERSITPEGKRDLASIRPMHEPGLRRGEVVMLDLADVDPEARTESVIGMGKSGRVPVTAREQQCLLLVK